MDRGSLVEPVNALLAAFTSSSPPSSIISTFTTDPKPLIHEHGLPQLAPFLGRTFSGVEGISEYFEILSRILNINSMVFEPNPEWLVDITNMCVTLRGAAIFEWKDTKNSWGETFIYRIALATDRSDDRLKSGRILVSEYRIWADTGAAYLARLGQLNRLDRLN
ncbi:uncharacterized protein N7483_007694 [Penicillium malachiteum]|uniref:uncharacterized protein n=1 Tax=Penicillium malachiteum TaxID=1324776 RepID=UPI0025498BE4|nr:uncharacterized protein N7483_007694 [Penicillium malachiteum]KAJ5726337.1 hypothetical protein N7483_007694 [Penicillium malachiteum]